MGVQFKEGLRQLAVVRDAGPLVNQSLESLWRILHGL
jgi:hypothetical protein